MAENPRDFWDLAYLIPPQKQKKSVVQIGENTKKGEGADASRLEPVEISAPPMEGKEDKDKTSLSWEDALLIEHPVDRFAPVPLPTSMPEKTYTVADSLVREVRIYQWRSVYKYYEQFREYAIKYHEKEGVETPEVDFFSYVPQYSQMSAAQLRYYFWWRTNFRKGIVLPAAYSYLLLYLYEIINLCDRIEPAVGQTQMLRLWLSYRGVHPRLDVLVREWLCDYSLLYELPPPQLPRSLFGTLITGCKLKEFYVSGMRGTDVEVLAVLLFCNNYDYKKSKYYREDTAELYDRVLIGAVERALRYLRERPDVDVSARYGYSTVSRDLFSGAVCSYLVKRRVEVDFTSFSHTHDLRYVITDVLKYCENAIRGAISVKSRLTVYQVSTELKRILDAYLEEVLPKKAPKRVEKSAMPEYEQRYEIPKTEISPERAAEIESASWETTKKLVEAFGEEEKAQPVCEKNETSATENVCDREEESVFNGVDAQHPSPDFFTESADLCANFGEKDESMCTEGALKDILGDFVIFIRLCAAGDVLGQREFARSRGLMLDAVADRINTAAVDSLGDMILNDEGGSYSVIEEYTEDLVKLQIL